MKLKCHRPALASAFQIVQGVVPSRTPREILKNVKLQIDDGKAVLIGTDQEIGIRYEIPEVEVETPGETLLPTTRVISILRELQDESVVLEVADDAVWIRGAHSEFRLSAEDPAEFPTVGAFEDERYHVVASGVLRQMIHRTIFATDVESTRYALGGVLVELEAEKITLAATDSRRLAVMSAACKTEGIEADEQLTPVIPAKAMALIERTLSDSDDEVFLAVHDNDVLVRSANSTIYSRLVEGRFPKYRDVIPADFNASIELMVGPFHSAVRQAQIVTSEESRGVDFAFGSGSLVLNSEAADIGQSKVELPLSYDGEPITITFDPRYIGEFLRVLEPETQIRFELTDSESAAVFRTDDDYTYVIMPLSKDR